MVQWADFPLNGKLNTSNAEVLLHRAMAAIENGYPNDGGGQSRFPGLEYFSQFPCERSYPFTFNGNLYAGTDTGRLYRISINGEAQDVTNVPISGGKRWTFAASDDNQLMMAAGGPIVRLTGRETSLLSRLAPNTTHVGFLDGYALALEDGNRFRYSSPNDISDWSDAQAFFSANARAGSANGLFVTPFRELLISKLSSIEQWETLSNGDKPFDRRWASGLGLAHPYTMVPDATGTYGVNEKLEFVRFAGQVSQDQSADVSLTLSRVDDWTEAWAQEVSMFGSRFIVLQMPFATNAYGTKGITMCLDYRNAKWMFLYGPLENGLPTRWPGWGFAKAYNRTFVGVPSGVAEISNQIYTMLGEDMRFLIRTPVVTKFGPSRIDDIRLRLQRGDGLSYQSLRRERMQGYLRENRSGLMREAPPPQDSLIGLRCNPDGEGFGEWLFESMGDHGQNQPVINFGAMGSAESWQFEIMCAANAPVEIADMMVWVERLAW